MIRLARIRPAEWQIAASAAGLLAVLFAVHWYAVGSPGRGWSGSVPLRFQFGLSGWSALGVLGPLALLAGLLGLGVWWLQGSRQAPALPVSATVIESVIALILTIGLIIRVLIDPPHLAGTPAAFPTDVRPGAYAGLALAVALLAGCYLSLRTDGIASVDSPRGIEVVEIPGPAEIGSPGSSA